MGHADITTRMVYVHFMPHADDAARLTRAFGQVPSRNAADYSTSPRMRTGGASKHSHSSLASPRSPRQ